MDHKQFQQALSLEINKMCELAISEDLNGSAGIDVSAQLIPANTNANANLITRDHAIVCGTEWLDTVFKLLGDDVVIDWKVKDGDRVKPSQLLCELKGNARQMLTGERSAMNFLQSLSSTATITDQYLQFLKGTDCQLLDTRKTIPGMRFGQKYAVTCGGGKNHRFGLHDAYLIKENHIMACGGIKEALNKAIELHPEKLLEIEVESLAELEQAIDCLLYTSDAA
ncbi:MAG: carboxylating nicotinate-nucleotide diphosphorylase, partial [Kangiellaceae bacterium]|nr:carboxylating nicotinate-nucleotide diphosphorylase [Kangiellaceae bacterium]